MIYGQADARRLAYTLFRHCKAQLATRGTIEKTAWSEKIVTGIIVADPHWDSYARQYAFSVTRWVNGVSVWRVRVYVKLDLDIRMSADEDTIPDEVARCIHGGLGEFED